MIHPAQTCKRLVRYFRNAIKPTKIEDFHKAGQGVTASKPDGDWATKNGMVQKGVRYRCAKHPEGRSGNGT